MQFVSWDKRFVDPIAVPGRKPLVTLRDAATPPRTSPNCPKAEHDADEWQAAMQALLLFAEQDGPPLFARIGIMRAINQHVIGWSVGPQPHANAISVPCGVQLFLWKRKISHHWALNNRHCLDNWGLRHFDSFDPPIRLVGISNKHIGEGVHCDGQPDSRS